jgi:hypothetical protein
MIRNHWVGVAGWMSAVIAAVSTAPVSAADLTAFQLIKEGNRYVGEPSKDKVVQIRSEKSVGGLEPAIWYIVYYDPDASLKATEVKFGAGEKLSVKRPMRLLEPVSGDDAALDRKRLKIDSKQAIQIALKEPLLAKLTMKATELRLERAGRGAAEPTLPVWRVRLWAAKLANPSKQAAIGEVVISAADGSVIERKLNINRVD